MEEIDDRVIGPFYFNHLGGNKRLDRPRKKLKFTSFIFSVAEAEGKEGNFIKVFHTILNIHPEI